MLIRINEKMKGIEVEFPANPGQVVTSQMVANGFRWHSKKKYWWAKATDKRMEFIEQLQKARKEEE